MSILVTGGAGYIGRKKNNRTDKYIVKRRK